MKKFLTIIAAVLLLATMLTACKTATDTPAQEKKVDLQALMTEINDTFGLADLNAVDSVDNLRRYYQIPTDKVAQFAAEYTAASTAYTEVIIVEGVDEAAAAEIKAKLDEDLRKKLSDAKSYHADQVATLEACEAKQNGNFAYLVVSDKQAEIVSKIEAAIG